MGICDHKPDETPNSDKKNQSPLLSEVNPAFSHEEHQSYVKKLAALQKKAI